MAEHDGPLMSDLLYLLRSGLYTSACALCKDKCSSSASGGSASYVNDGTLVLLAGYAHALLGDVSEAERTLSPVVTSPHDVHTAAAARAALAHAHRRTEAQQQHEAAGQHERCIDEALARGTTQHAAGNGAKSKYLGALYLYLVGDSDSVHHANIMCDKALKLEPEHPHYNALKGWIELSVSKSHDPKAALKYFEDANRYSEGRKFIDGHIGISQYHYMRHNFQASLECLSKASAILSTSATLGALSLYGERTKVHLAAARDWERAIDSANRCTSLSHGGAAIGCECVALHACIALDGGDAVDIDAKLADLCHAIEQHERANAALCYRVATIFGAMSCGRAEQLHQCVSLCESGLAAAKAARRTDWLAAGHAAHARLMLCKGSAKAAVLAYRKAIEAGDDTGHAALGAGDTLPAVQCLRSRRPRRRVHNNSMCAGVVHCLIKDGSLAEAKAQMDFARATLNSGDNSQTLQYLETLMIKRADDADTQQQVISKLQYIVDNHFAALKSTPFGVEYIRKLDLDFLLDIVMELFDYLPLEPNNSVQSWASFKEIQRILTVCSDALPGLVTPMYLLARAKYMAAEWDGALGVLQRCLSRDQTLAHCHLLMAQIFVHKNNFKMAQQSLEVGLSYNFAVRDHPLYYLIRARIHLRSGNVEAAVNQLKAAIKLPAFLNEAEQSSGPMSSSQLLALTDDDRMVIYLELIDALHANSDNSGAESTIAEAVRRFSGTRHEHRLVLARADSALARNDADAALKLLEAVKPDEHAYFAARRKLAEIYLHHKKDKRQFAIVYKELVEKNPTPQAFVLLGDAYMSIQEPERAIEVYEAALKRDPKDHALARKIGQAYVQAHLYNKALNYYEAALKTGQQNFLRMDLAELLFRLKNYDKCERVLQHGLEKSAALADPSALYDEVRLLALLARLRVARGDAHAKGMQELARAKQHQARLVNNAMAQTDASAPLDIGAQKAYAKELCVELADYAESRRDLDSAISLYKEALSYVESDTKVMLALAQAYLSTGKTDDCNAQCQLLLKLDPNNADATLLVADILYQKNDTSAALMHYEKLLEHNPNQYAAVCRLVELCWRTGNLERAERALDAAAAAHSRATLQPGYNYCRAVFDWRTGDLNAALQHFGRARRDEIWGEAATLAIIEICLNPDNEIIGGEAMDQTVADDSQSTISEDKEMGIKTAERFLRELRQSNSINAFKTAGSFNYKLMENYIQLAGKTRTGAESALHEFITMIGDETDEGVDPAAILGASRAHLLLKQGAKAKALLRRMSNRMWTLENAAHLEQCWLLLADIYINAGKYDVANNLLENVLKHNASSIKAYEYVGLVREKEADWASAAQQYARAWHVGRRRNAALGYKLAHCELRAKRYFHAIDACNRVLELHPNYPNIKKDVLFKARNQLRM